MGGACRLVGFSLVSGVQFGLKYSWYSKQSWIYRKTLETSLACLIQIQAGVSLLSLCELLSTNQVLLWFGCKKQSVNTSSTKKSQNQLCKLYNQSLIRQSNSCLTSSKQIGKTPQTHIGLKLTCF